LLIVEFRLPSFARWFCVSFSPCVVCLALLASLASFLALKKAGFAVCLVVLVTDYCFDSVLAFALASLTMFAFCTSFFVGKMLTSTREISTPSQPSSPHQVHPHEG
jgi:hypothetical protein